MSDGFEVNGSNPSALFTLKIHRGDGMSLLAMNWKNGKPPDNFVGFGIEYKEPKGDTFFALKNRLTFPGIDQGDPNAFSTLRSPIQKFRWVHFPRNANLDGDFTYRVSPVFMNDKDELSVGDPQLAAIELRRETYPNQLNIAYTRGFVSSQAFVDRYKTTKGLLPVKANQGLNFVPTHPQAKDALAWMGFEAREAILDVLDQAVADTGAQVRCVGYDLNNPEVVSRLEKLGSRLKVIIDNSADHGAKGSAEDEAEKRLVKSAGRANVQRQHMGSLQHNKFVAVDGKVQLAVCGSTNFSWRAFYVQNNNALVLQGKTAVKPFFDAFDSYSKNSSGVGKTDVAGFGAAASAKWTNLGLAGIDAKLAFSPHAAGNALLTVVADDIQNSTSSCLFYSLAFLYQTKGVIKDAIVKVTSNKDLFVYGISDRKVGGLDLQKPDGNLAAVFPAELSKGLPEPFKSEPTGGGGIRMHHKFLVIDFDQPTARVYMGSYNFSTPADLENGENLLLIRDRRVAVSYLVEALSMFDHYHFRVAQKEARAAKKKLELAKPPRKRGNKPWWAEYYTDRVKIRDRELFA
jgi:phosphatidylserine/phosphatidylglycerophosphate/cardiolipin synthase-like enzyme